ncbi:MAG: cell wall metabolism sensor histidine kinase WalK, partial [Anaerolineaceae bacterium]|nr:cell wall metabolism sensor histidine kinase WalK [Anaerolineaceae bacterium]
MRKRSYVWKISLPYLALVLVSLLGISLYLSNYFRNFIEENWKNNLTDQAHLYTELTAPLIEQGYPYAGLSDLVASSSAGTLDRVTIILPDGLVIADNEADPATMENHANRPEVKSALSGQFGTDIRTSATLGVRYLYVAVPVEENGQTIAIARLSISLASLDASVNQIRLFLLIFSSVIILISLLYSLFYAFRKNNPLARLTDTVEGVRQGQTWNIELNQRNDEIGTLASSFFELTNQLNHQITDLKNERMKLAAILTNMTDGAILVNSEGIVTLINPAARHLFGFYEDIAS